LLETVPAPVPVRLTLNVGLLWFTLKVAVTCWLALSVTVQIGLLPLHAPVQPTKDEPVVAVAVRVTGVPWLKVALQVCPQLMPAGVLTTLPLPVPPRVTANAGEVLKLAITEAFCVNVTLQAPMPLQEPDHPAKKEFCAGAAVSVTWVPLAKLALQA
jgi:hypothetical protein